MKWIVAVLLMVVSVNAYASDIVTKVSDESIKVEQTVKNEVTLTVAQIKHEIQGIDRDIETITTNFNQAVSQFQARKDMFNNLLTECEKLGVKEPVIKDNPIDVVE